MLALPVVGHPNKSHLKWTMNPEFRVKQTRQLVALVVYVICLYTDAYRFYVHVRVCVTMRNRLMGSLVLRARLTAMYS